MNEVHKNFLKECLRNFFYGNVGFLISAWQQGWSLGAMVLFEPHVFVMSLALTIVGRLSVKAFDYFWNKKQTSDNAGFVDVGVLATLIYAVFGVFVTIYSLILAQKQARVKKDTEELPLIRASAYRTEHFVKEIALKMGISARTLEGGVAA